MRSLEILYRTRTPTVIWGPPGVGKTATIEALARREGAELIVPQVRAPEDIALPVLDGGGVKIVPVGEFLRAVRSPNAIVFLDEISTLPPAVQAAALRFLDSGLVGGERIPPTVWRVAAANPPEQAAAGWDLAAPTANRLVHVNFHLDPMRWADDFVTYWGSPPRVGDLEPEAWARARAKVSAFIHSRPTLLLKIPQTEEERGRAWPSPRTWDFASRLLALAPDELAGELVAGAVGEGAAVEFFSWLRAQDLPDPEDLLSNPALYVHPDRGDRAYAILSSVVAAVSARPSEARWHAAWEIVARAVAGGAPDIAAASARSLARMRQAGWELPIQSVRSLAPVLREAGMLQP